MGPPKSKKNAAKRKKAESNTNEDHHESQRKHMDKHLRAAIDYPYIKEPWIFRHAGCLPKTKTRIAGHKKHPFDLTDPFKRNRFAQTAAKLFRPPKEIPAYKAKKWQVEDDSDEDA